MLAAPFFAINIGDAKPGSHSTSLPANVIVNGLHELGQRGSPPPAVLRAALAAATLTGCCRPDCVARLLLQDERVVSAVEYGLIAALIAVACVEALTTVGTKLSWQPIITPPTQKKQSLTGRPQGHIFSAADFVSGSGFGGDGCSELGRNSSR